jgi:hypothetical protein
VIYKNGIAVIYDPKAWDRGTVLKPDHGFDDFLRWTKPGGMDTETPIISPPRQLPPMQRHPRRRSSQTAPFDPAENQ